MFKEMLFRFVAGFYARGSDEMTARLAGRCKQKAVEEQRAASSLVGADPMAMAVYRGLYAFMQTASAEWNEQLSSWLYQRLGIEPAPEEEFKKQLQSAFMRLVYEHQLAPDEAAHRLYQIHTEIIEQIDKNAEGEKQKKMEEIPQ